MKTIGLIGGMSWESTAHYYAILNRETAKALGGLHSAPVIVHSVDFAPVAELQSAGNWDGAGAQLAAIAQSLEAQGCGVIGLATNTMHICAPQIVAGLSVPFVHIAAPTADALLADGIGKVGLLGTRFTMEKRFYIEARQIRPACQVTSLRAEPSTHARAASLLRSARGSSLQ